VRTAEHFHRAGVLSGTRTGPRGVSSLLYQGQGLPGCSWKDLPTRHLSAHQRSLSRVCTAHSWRKDTGLPPTPPGGFLGSPTRPPLGPSFSLLLPSRLQCSLSCGFEFPSSTHSAGPLEEDPGGSLCSPLLPQRLAHGRCRGDSNDKIVE
jgi:hypothetical protein